MRKDGAWRGLQAALCVGMVCGCLLCGTAVRADNARDPVVNPGNALHLGASEKAAPAKAPEEAAPDEAAPGAELNDADGGSTVGQGDGEDEEEPQRAAAHCGIIQQDITDWDFHGPLASIGQHPPSTLFYQPVPDSALLLESGSSASTRLDWMNLIIRELDSGVVVDYDYEELRTTFDYRKRLGAGELMASVPVYHRGSGMLDEVIEGWHKLFGMNNGLRDAYAENQFRYTVISRDGLVYNGLDGGTGLGDVALGYKGRLGGGRDSREAAAWRVALKAPTGDSAQAFGSGGWDYSAGLLYQRQLGRKLRLYANVDYVVTGEPDWQNVAKHNTWHTTWAAEYAWTPRFSLVAQYNTATNPLRIGSFEADKDPREVSVGFHHRLSDKLLWTGGFREDISPETAPDLVFLSYFKWDL